MKFYKHVGETLEKLRKTENRVASDEDLKMSDLFRYYMRDTSAAKVSFIFKFVFCLRFISLGIAKPSTSMFGQL